MRTVSLPNIGDSPLKYNDLARTKANPKQQGKRRLCQVQYPSDDLKDNNSSDKEMELTWSGV